MRLELWSVVTIDDDPYKAPELRTPHLCGVVYGHPRFEDGHNITTSTIKGRVGTIVVTFSGSKYELGEVDSGYEKLYPNAKDRLIKSLKEL